MNKTKRYIILIVIGAVFMLIGGAVQDATGNEGFLPLFLIPVGILWLYLFPVGKKK